MAESGAVGVLVHVGFGRPIQDMDCVDVECYKLLWFQLWQQLWFLNVQRGQY